jgi:hypothetical protein
MPTEKPPAGPGRPTGSVATPRTQLRIDMMQTSKLNREMRGLAEKLVKDLKIRAESPDLPLKDRLEILSTLTGALQNQSRSMESIVKLLAAADAVASDHNEEQTAEDVLNELQGKRRVVPL